MTNPYLSAYFLVSIVIHAGQVDYFDGDNASGVSCEVCMVGVNCNTSANTLRSLPLITGYWRPGHDSRDVRRCPDASRHGTACQGGTGAMCRPGLMGTFCALCDTSNATEHMYYVEATESEVAHCEPCGNSLASTVLMALGAVALVAALVTAVSRYEMSEETRRRLQQLMARTTPLNKLKIVTGFYMIASRVDDVYDVHMPESIQDFLNQMKLTVSFGLQGFAMTPLECMGASGYIPRLTFWFLVPLMWLGVLSLFFSLRMKANGIPLRIDALADSVTHPLLGLLFIVYPIITNVAFQSFPCHEFSDGRSWLVTDVAIECGTSEHDNAKSLAMLTILVYPVGLWVGALYLLLSVRKEIADHEAAKGTIKRRSRSGGRVKASRRFKAIEFLFREYEARVFWWELAEMARRLVLVGFLVVVEPGKIIQVFLGTTFSAAYLMIQLQAKPFVNRSDDYLALSSSFCLLMLFICSILYKYEALTESAAIRGKMSIEQRDDYVYSEVLLFIWVRRGATASLRVRG